MRLEFPYSVTLKEILLLVAWINEVGAISSRNTIFCLCSRSHVLCTAACQLATFLESDIAGLSRSKNQFKQPGSSYKFPMFYTSLQSVLVVSLSSFTSSLGTAQATSFCQTPKIVNSLSMEPLTFWRLEGKSCSFECSHTRSFVRIIFRLPVPSTNKSSVYWPKRHLRLVRKCPFLISSLSLGNASKEQKLIADSLIYRHWVRPFLTDSL